MTALLAHLAGPRGATGSCDGTLSIQLPNGIRTDRLTNLIFQLLFFLPNLIFSSMCMRCESPVSYWSTFLA